MRLMRASITSSVATWTLVEDLPKRIFDVDQFAPDHRSTLRRVGGTIAAKTFSSRHSCCSFNLA